MRILFAEDERDLNDLVSRRLTSEGYSVDRCYDGQEALDYLRSAAYDAVILDVMMPRVDGLTVLRRLRAEGNRAPVLLLTARDAISDRVAGLDAGANDYLVKPFALDELCARLRVLTRAAYGAADSVLRVGDLCVDTGARRVTRGGVRVELSAREYALLETSPTTRARCFRASRLRITCGALITRAARTWWTCTFAICAKSWTTGARTS